MVASPPVFVICRDRLTPTQRLVAWLERHDVDRIVLVDNASTYEPLLEFLDASPHHVARLGDNLGPRAVWTAGLRDRYAKGEPYIVSDCDVVPDEACPDDAIDYLSWALARFPRYVKAGLGLRIDDLPDCYALADDVRQWERRFWLRRFAGNLYHANVDTTFALYRPGSQFQLAPAIRAGFPYVARHLPWYSSTTDPTDEERYYRDHCLSDITNWNGTPGMVVTTRGDRLPLLGRAYWRYRVSVMRHDRSVPRRFPAATIEGATG
jgi:hypothetical protein